MLQVDAFWEFSVELYGKDPMQQQCLQLQDQHDLNVNILLLCCFLQRQNLSFSREDARSLIDAAVSTQIQLKQMREHRKKHKGTAEYQQLLTKELDIEKQQQAELIETVNTLRLIQGAGNNVKTYVQAAKNMVNEELEQDYERFNAAALEWMKTLD